MSRASGCEAEEMHAAVIPINHGDIFAMSRSLLIESTEPRAHYQKCNHIDEHIIINCRACLIAEYSRTTPAAAPWEIV